MTSQKAVNDDDDVTIIPLCKIFMQVSTKC